MRGCELGFLAGVSRCHAGRRRADVFQTVVVGDGFCFTGESVFSLMHVVVILAAGQITGAGNLTLVGHDTIVNFIP